MTTSQTDTFEFADLQGDLEQASLDVNEAIDGLIGPLVESTPLGDLVSTGNKEQPPFTSDPHDVGIFASGDFVFGLLG